MTNTGTLKFAIADLTTYDQIELSGALVAAGTIAIVLDGYAPQLGDSFDLIRFGSFVDDGYAFSFSDASLPAGLAWDTSDFSTTGSIRVVPEPGTFVLLGISGAAGLLACAWRRWRKAS